MQRIKNSTVEENLQLIHRYALREWFIAKYTWTKSVNFDVIEPTFWKLTNYNRFQEEILFRKFKI